MLQHCGVPPTNHPMNRKCLLLLYTPQQNHQTLPPHAVRGDPGRRALGSGARCEIQICRLRLPKIRGIELVVIIWGAWERPASFGPPNSHISSRAAVCLRGWGSHAGYVKDETSGRMRESESTKVAATAQLTETWRTPLSVAPGGR